MQNPDVHTCVRPKPQTHTKCGLRFVSYFNLGFILLRLFQLNVITFVYHYLKRRFLSHAFIYVESVLDNETVKFIKGDFSVLMDMSMKIHVCNVKTFGL
jgi:hypothetical protein